jgi:hypothetical protein
MSLYASWIHGNAVTVEAPQNLDRVQLPLSPPPRQRHSCPHRHLFGPHMKTWPGFIAFFSH